jgi:hypothetical protein
MKVAIDVHGTIDSDPLFWNKTIILLSSLGIEVYVLSGPKELEIERRLTNLNVPTEFLAGIISVQDYLEKTYDRSKYWYDDLGRFWIDDGVWFSAKATLCVIHRIDVMIDDMRRYMRSDIAKYTKFIWWIGLKYAMEKRP